MFKQIKKGHKCLPLFSKLEGLLLQDELSQNLDTQRETSEDINFIHHNWRPYRGGQTYRGHSNFNTGTISPRIDSRSRSTPLKSNNAWPPIYCHKYSKLSHLARNYACITLEERIKAMQLQLSNMTPRRSSQEINLVEADEDEDEDSIAKTILKLSTATKMKNQTHL